MSGEFTREQLIECVEREIRQRERVYPRLVELGRMSGTKSRLELAMMREVREVLVALPSEPPKQGGLFR